MMEMHGTDRDVAAGRLNVIIENLERDARFFDGGAGTVQICDSVDENSRSS